jgi:hypothetical protein
VKLCDCDTAMLRSLGLFLGILGHVDGAQHTPSVVFLLLSRSWRWIYFFLSEQLLMEVHRDVSVGIAGRKRLKS